MLSALSRSLALLAKPDNITVPLRVSTLIDEPATFLSSKKRALTLVVMAASSM
jgi:hypothetical protein